MPSTDGSIRARAYGRIGVGLYVDGISTRVAARYGASTVVGAHRERITACNAYGRSPAEVSRDVVACADLRKGMSAGQRADEGHRQVVACVAVGSGYAKANGAALAGADIVDVGYAIDTAKSRELVGAVGDDELQVAHDFADFHAIAKLLYAHAYRRYLRRSCRKSHLARLRVERYGVGQRVSAASAACVGYVGTCCLQTVGQRVYERVAIGVIRQLLINHRLIDASKWRGGRSKNGRVIAGGERIIQARFDVKFVAAWTREVGDSVVAAASSRRKTPIVTARRQRYYALINVLLYAQRATAARASTGLRGAKRGNIRRAHQRRIERARRAAARIIDGKSRCHTDTVTVAKHTQRYPVLIRSDALIREVCAHRVRGAHLARSREQQHTQQPQPP